MHLTSDVADRGCLVVEPAFVGEWHEFVVLQFAGVVAKARLVVGCHRSGRIGCHHDVAVHS
ncbi:MAG: hypothetical protein DWC01_01755 [Candidatus Poseidoniales archaeon]|nr:MAG: hypothetical protein DWC01_01755 [Candidatus Poseidoniales archaeon]